MGYFGFQPVDSDAALDAYVLVSRAANTVLESLFAATNPSFEDRWARLGALQASMERHLSVSLYLLYEALEDLSHLKCDEFFDIWENPQGIKESVILFTEAFEEMCEKTERQYKLDRGSSTGRYNATAAASREMNIFVNLQNTLQRDRLLLKDDVIRLERLNRSKSSKASSERIPEITLRLQDRGWVPDSEFSEKWEQTTLCRMDRLGYVEFNRETYCWKLLLDNEAKKQGLRSLMELFLEQEAISHKDIDGDPRLMWAFKQLNQKWKALRSVKEHSGTTRWWLPKSASLNPAPEGYILPSNHHSMRDEVPEHGGNVQFFMLDLHEAEGESLRVRVQWHPAFYPSSTRRQLLTLAMDCDGDGEPIESFDPDKKSFVDALFTDIAFARLFLATTEALLCKGYESYMAANT